MTTTNQNMDSLNERLYVLEQYIENHVATKEQVQRLEEKINDRFDRVEEDIRSIKADLQEVLNYVRP